MELPRELQVYILSFLYDPWRKRWNEVIRTLKSAEILIRNFQLSHLMLKTWVLPNRRVLQYRICLDCGNYYQIPLYSCSVVGCDCP